MDQNYISKKEMGCKCGCGFDRLHPDLIDIFNKIRTKYGSQIKVNSACRCKKHNENIKGSPKSYHLFGLALDITAPDFDILIECVNIILDGKYGMGINYHKKFIHIDLRPEYKRWYYDINGRAI